MSIETNILSLRTQLPSTVKLVCVSKFNPIESIQQAYDCGERIFGESKVQELCEKYELLPKDIQWHFIGHLQTNKIKYIVPFVSLIHGVDSYKLLQEINKVAEKQNKVINCLLQVHIALEDTKFGFSESELLETLSNSAWKELKNIQICGLMGMATFTSNKQQIESEFRNLKMLFNTLKTSFFSDLATFSELSMGMSDDYKIAIEEGSTIIRVGSSIFGSRMYNS